MAVPRVGLAKQVKITITGLITSGWDYTGVFGAPNSDLTGKSYTQVVIVDDTKGTQTVGGNGPSYSTIAATANSNPMTATLTIGGGTIYYGVLPTSATPNSLVSRQSDQMYIYTGGENYAVGNAEGFGVISTSIFFNDPPYAANYNWESALDYSPAAGNDNSGGSFIFYRAYVGDTTWRQNTDGFFHVTNITEIGLTPPPPLGQGVPPNNNGGNMCPVPSPAGGPKMSMPIAGPQMSMPVGKPVQSFVGDPINAGTGNLFETQTDFTAPANTQLSFTRYYNSYDQSSAGLGVGWHSTYHRGLSATAAAVTVIRADGRQDIYKKKGTSYVPDPDVTGGLTPAPATGAQTGWKLKLDDDSTEIYTLAGRLTSITTRAGLTTTLTYNVANQLSTVTGPFDHKLTFTYDTSNRVSTMTIPDGGKFTYGYDGRGNLASVTHPDNTTRWYLYENLTYPDLLTSLVDEDGNVFASWTYDSQGRATSSQHAGGADRTTVAYNGASSTVTDARGNAHTYTSATQCGLVKPATISGVGCGCSSGAGKAFTYDANGFISSLTDFDGNVTTFVHNALGEETSRTEASGTALARTITTFWSPTFHLPTKIIEPNRTTTFNPDPSNGNLLSKSVTDGTHTRTWTYTYNTHGQVLTAKDPDNHVTTTTYDAKGDVQTIKNALNQLWSFPSYDADGKLLSTTDPNGLVTAFTYDKLGRILTRKVGTLTTSYNYDPAGMPNLLTLPDSSAYKYSYDAAHRLTQIQDAAGDTVDYSYDATSNLAEVNVYDPSKTLTRTHSYTYDQGNRLQTDTGAVAGEKSTYTYDDQGNLLTRTDPLGHVSTYTYDALNRRRSFLDPLHNKTDYSYNENDDLTAVIDPRGLATIYTYDGLDDQTGVRSPDTDATTRIFDPAGNVLTSMDARDKVSTYKYDALNRPLTITWTGGETVTYTYDTGTYGIGHLTKMVDPAGATSFTYDHFGHLLTKAQTTDSVTLNQTLRFDGYGRLQWRQYPSGAWVEYTYDVAGRVSALSYGALNITNVTYEPFGSAKSWTEPNGATYARTFDKDGRITGIALGGTVNVQTLTYDHASRIIGLTETGISAKTYGYDNDDRLTGFINGTVATKYTYDADSNRSSMITAAGTTTYHYPTTSNRLSSLSGLTTQTETYDASGNQIGDGATTYDYDARGRMSSAIAAGVTTSYAVNGFGQRIRKSGSDVPNGEANEYVYDEQGHSIGEYNSIGGIVNETVYLGDTPVAVLTGSGGVTIYSVSADWLNTPHIIQNASKENVWTWDHYAFGDNAPKQNPSGLGALPYNLRFPGQHYDAESGLYYNMARDYNAQLGRYVESDSIGLGAGNNTYGYASESPLNRTDALGLDDCPTTKKCKGMARVLEGNPATVGHNGGWGIPVQAGTAAVITSQWGGKGNLRPYINGVSATYNGQQLFNGISDIVGGEPIDGMPPSQYLMNKYPDDLIIELVNGSDYGIIPIELTIPIALSCPAHTTEVKSQ